MSEENTNAPAENEENLPEGAEVYDGEVANYKITGIIYPCDEDGVLLDTPLEIDSIQNVPVVVGDKWVADGLAEKVEEAKPEIEPAPAGDVVPGKVSVLDAQSHFVREYSSEIHGEGFKELAEQYAASIGGKVI